jgi:hypothetical protein
MLSLVLALALQGASAPAKDEAAAASPPATQAAAPAKPPPGVETGVDANGVPAWAKRRKLTPVQNCGTKPNIGVETWRGEYDTNIKGQPKLHNAPAKCH